MIQFLFSCLQASQLLWAAASDGDLQTVRRALDEDADPHSAQNPDGHTPLTIAALNGHLAVVKELIGREVDLDDVGKSTGVTALLGASFEGHLEIVEALLHAKADSNAAEVTTGVTPLFAAAQEGYLDVVNALLKAGAAVDKARTLDDATPLYAACALDRPSVVRVLVEAGADAHRKRSGIGDTPFTVASEYGLSDVVRILETVKYAAKSASLQSGNMGEVLGGQLSGALVASETVAQKDGEGDGEEGQAATKELPECLSKAPAGLEQESEKMDKGEGEVDNCDETQATPEVDVGREVRKKDGKVKSDSKSVDEAQTGSKSGSLGDGKKRNGEKMGKQRAKSVDEVGSGPGTEAKREARRRDEGRRKEDRKRKDWQSSAKEPAKIDETTPASKAKTAAGSDKKNDAQAAGGKGSSKRRRSDTGGKAAAPPAPLDAKANEFEVQELLETRMRKRKNGALVREYKVRWKGFGPNEDTWEPEENLTRGVEELLLEFSKPGGKKVKKA
ncbi:unnamed protein product [Ostreobium quekettii]|uniref:Chromo domain-containing protein n=1 Tax=Ostreobium quekettii TaxID=121088 RepID=A0A8S1IPD6_9CHLO|nr:unnamed protein product [Ostreobium quekettii]